MTVVKSFSFTSQYEKELEYFLSIPNKSKYICDLIRKDMEGSQNKVIVKDIEKMIEEKIKSLSLNIEKESDVSNIIDLEVRDNLEDVLGGFN